MNERDTKRDDDDEPKRSKGAEEQKTAPGFGRAKQVGALTKPTKTGVLRK